MSLIRSTTQKRVAIAICNGKHDFPVMKPCSHQCTVLKSADTVVLYPRSTDCWQAWVGIRSRWALVDAAELHRTARQRKRNRQCSLSETAVTELHRALSRGFISRLVNSDASRLYGDSLTAKRSIKAKNRR